MTNNTTPLADDNEEDAGRELSYDEWNLTLSVAAQTALAELRQQEEMRAEAALKAQESSGEVPLTEILSAIVEVRDLLRTQHLVRDYYSTEQAGLILNRAKWTVREWCRQGRVHAEKRHSGRGRGLDWVISHAELQRIQKEGLLPVVKH